MGLPVLDPASYSLAQFPATGLLLLILLILAGGFLGAPFWWLDVEQSFSWNLPPLASRMLASAGWAFAVAILLFHLDRFNPTASITYVFFLIVGVMSIATIWYLLRPVGILLNSAEDTGLPDRATRVYLSLVSITRGHVIDNSRKRACQFIPYNFANNNDLWPWDSPGRFLEPAQWEIAATIIYCHL